MRSPRRAALLAVVLTIGVAVSAPPARGQGWDYGRNMFGFVQSTPGVPWSGQYHPGDGRPGIYFSDAGGGNFFGDPKGRPSMSPIWGPGPPPHRRRAHGRWGAGMR